MTSYQTSPDSLITPAILQPYINGDMDPLSILAIATACATFLDFSAKLLKLFKTICHDGEIPELSGLQARAKTLLRIQKRLNEEPQNEAANTDPQRQAIVERLKLSSKQVRQAANKCSQTAQELLELLADLQDASKTGAKQAFRKLARLVQQQKRIAKLDNALQQCRGLYDSAVLHKLQPSVDLMSLEQREGFETMKSRYDEIMTKLRYQELSSSNNQEAAKTEILKSVSEEGSKTRDTVSRLSKELKGFASVSERDACRKTVMDSLFFREYTARKEQVEPAQKNTFGWAFSAEEQCSDVPWSPFSDWLRNGSDLYWIHGKAGSGKSTLCSFLVDHPDTRQLIEEWAHGQNVSFASYFFWTQGTTLQKSISGVLRSLLYQLAEGSDEITDDIGQVLNVSSGRVPALSNKTLKNSILKALNKSDHHFCLFVDGLDEYEGDTKVLLGLCNDLRKLANVKLIVSSRTQPPFSREFIGCPSIRLQDINYSDIKAYVCTELERDIFPLWTDVINDAEGIFLWAKLVVRSLNDAYLEGDNLETLQKRLEKCPRDLDELYEHLLGSIDKIYEKETAFYFLAVMMIERLSLHQLILALKIHGGVTLPVGICPETSAPLTPQELTILVNRVSHRTRGLIEFTRGMVCEREWAADTAELDYKFPKTDTNETMWLYPSIARYMHRTAVDFVTRHLETTFITRVMTREKVSLCLLEAELELVLKFPLCKVFFCALGARMQINKLAESASTAIKWCPEQRADIISALENVRIYLSDIRVGDVPPSAPYAIHLATVSEISELDENLLECCLIHGLLDYVSQAVRQLTQQRKLMRLFLIFSTDYLNCPEDISFGRMTAEVLQRLQVPMYSSQASRRLDTFTTYELEYFWVFEQYTSHEQSADERKCIRLACSFLFMIIDICVNERLTDEVRELIVNMFKQVARLSRCAEVYVSVSGNNLLPYSHAPRIDLSHAVFINLNYLAQAYLYSIGCEEPIFTKPDQPVRFVCYRSHLIYSNENKSLQVNSNIREVIDAMCSSLENTEERESFITDVIGAAEEKFRCKLILEESEPEEYRLPVEDFIPLLTEISTRENAFIDGNARDLTVDDFILKERGSFVFGDLIGLRRLWINIQLESPHFTGEMALLRIVENTTDDLKEFLIQKVVGKDLETLLSENWRFEDLYSMNESDMVETGDEVADAGEIADADEAEHRSEREDSAEAEAID